MDCAVYGRYARDVILFTGGFLAASVVILLDVLGLSEPPIAQPGS